MVYLYEPAPHGHVVVTGADYNTAGAIRSGDTWFVDPRETVKIPKPHTPMYETLPTRELTAAQQAALDAVVRGDAERIALPSDRWDEAEVRFPRLMPNTSGRILVRREDLEPEREAQ